MMDVNEMRKDKRHSTIWGWFGTLWCLSFAAWDLYMLTASTVGFAWLYAPATVLMIFLGTSSYENTRRIRESYDELIELAEKNNKKSDLLKDWGRWY